MNEVPPVRPQTGALEQSQPDLWTYTPPCHKSQHRGKSRVIPCGPQTVAILSRHLLSTCPRCGTTDRRRRLAMRSNLCGPCADRTDEAGICGPWRMLTLDLPLFSPQDAREDHYATLRASRKSKVQPSQVSRRKPHPKRPAGETYTSNSYNQAIRRACDMAGIARFHAHQIRHAAATRIRERFGLETARDVLGHSSLSTTLIYAAENARRAAEAIRLIG